MARKPINYWEKRSTELMKRLEKGTENTINSLIQVYEQATKNINKEIANIFKNYAKDSGLDKKTLIQLLNKKETETHYKNLLEVINNNITDERIKKKLLAKYNAPAYSYRISRYQALQDNIDVELKKLANVEQQITEIRYVDTIKEGYYHNIYDIQKGTGLGFNFAQIDNRTINLMLNENWVDGGNFSQRIWNNSEKLGNYLKTQLTANSMSGKSILKIASELSEYMNVGLYMATRLVRTETNYFANQAELLSMQECGIEKYVYMATLDNVTCEHCAELDGKKFLIKNAKKGVNCPPLHSNDRCGIVSYFDEEELEGLTRRARDENGKSILVSQDTTYEQWKEKYVTNSNNGGIIKEQQNKKIIKKAKTFKVQKKDTLLSNFDKYKDIDVSELTPDQRNLVINYKLYKMDMGDEYLELAKKSNEKIIQLENIKNRKSNYFDNNFGNKYNKAKRYTTEQSDELTNLYKNKLETLNLNQKNSIADYTGIDYEDINRALRTERKVNERLSKNIDNITDVLNNSNTVEDMIVHRHVEFDGASKFTGLKEYQLKQTNIEELNNILKGKECTDKAFVSTSLRDFKEELREVVYDIYMPKGTKGLYINELSTSYKDVEYEFLLQRETKFKIQEVFKDTDGTLRIVMEVIGNGM